MTVSARALGAALIPAIVAADQLSKWAITEKVLRPLSEEGGMPVPLAAWLAQAPERLGPANRPLLPFFDFNMVWNPGISFGFLTSGPVQGPMVLTVLSLLICVFFGIWLVRSAYRFEAAALALVIGGAIGNIIDRLRFGAVADFFHVFYGSWSFPAFNVADSAITVGVAMLLIHGLFLSNDKQVQGKE